LGEIEMNYLFLRKLSVTLVLVMAFIGCATNKTVPNNDIIGLKAKNASEGIVLTFDNIPSEAARMFIHIMEIEEGANPVPVFTDIRGTLLEQVKEKGKVVCPFVQNGHHYYIAVAVNTVNNVNSPYWENVEITANNGVHTLNEISLELNNAQTGVTLSAEPVFSGNVQYDSQKYRYMVTIKAGTNDSIGYGEHANNKLTWEFMPRMIEDLKKDNINVSGNLPAYVTAYCNINYDDLLWAVGVVTSKEFTVSL
jgi:hypothetical protein